MFKIMNGLFSQEKLTIPKPSTNYLKRSYSYSKAMLQINLPKSVKNAVSVNHFKQIRAIVISFSSFLKPN